MLECKQFLSNYKTHPIGPEFIKDAETKLIVF